MKNLILIMTIVATPLSQAAQYKYNELVVKDYDEMASQVQKHLKSARKMGKKSDAAEEESDDSERQGAVEELREALKLIFSRPNSDNMVAKLTPEIRRELGGYNSYEKTIMSLTNEALGAVNSDQLNLISKATYLFMLENIISEIGPESQTNKDLRAALVKIKNSKVKISDEVKKERKLRSMYPEFNPSEEANKVLLKIDKLNKEDEKKESGKKTKGAG